MKFYSRMLIEFSFACICQLLVANRAGEEEIYCTFNKEDFNNEGLQ